MKNRYQLEVPDSIVAPAEYDLKSQRKGFRRYRTQWVESILESLVQHEEQRDVALKDTMRTVFHRFGDKWVWLTFGSGRGLLLCFVGLLCGRWP